MRVEIKGPLGCHIWLGATTPRDYPVMRAAGKVCLARRVLYERKRRPLQPGERVIMDCGERRCVNTDHMRAVMRRSRP